MGSDAHRATEGDSSEAIPRGEWLRVVLDHINVPVSLKDLDGRYFLINHRFAGAYRFAPERVPGRTDHELFPPEVADRFREHDLAALEAGHAVEREEAYPYPGGPPASIVVKFPLNDPDGSPRAICSIVAEAAGHRAEMVLRESEQRVATILENIADDFIAMDSEWRFVYINAQAERSLGRSKGELLGRVAWEEFPDLIDSDLYRNYHRAVAEGVPVEFEVDHPRLGRRFRLHAYPGRDGLSVYHTDVTERHRAEKALQDSERRFRLVLENSRDVIYQLNLATWTYDYMSPSAKEVLGGDPEEFASGGLERTLALIHPDDIGSIRRYVDRLMTAEEPDEFEPLLEYRLRVEGKGWRWMSDSRSLLRGPDGGPPSLVGTVRDVTDQKAAGDRLRDLTRRLARAQEEERGRIARELHDEIGSALTAIKFNLLGAMKDPGSPSSTRRLEEGIKLAERTIDQVRDISLDLRPAILDDIGLVEALRSQVNGFAKRTGIEATLETRGAPGPPDPDRETACFRIAQEALTNVARHSGARRVRVELTFSEAKLGLVVADDGSGFDVEGVMARAAGGTSLGVLSMSERAALVGGRVEIRSGDGEGAEIRAELPIGREAAGVVDDPRGA